MHTTSPPLGLSNVSNHGGPVMAATTVYAIFWAPSGSTLTTTYRNAVVKYFQNVAADSGKTGNAYAVLPEYSTKSTTVKYKVTYGGSTVATQSIPSDSTCKSFYPSGGSGLVGCATESDQVNEVAKVLTVKGWSRGLNKIYFLFLPEQVGSCYDDYTYCAVTNGSTGGYCGYHDWFGSTSKPAIWANISYPSSRASARSTATPATTRTATPSTRH